MRRKAEFELAIDGVAPFKALYEAYKGKRLAEREIMKDVLREANFENIDLDECVDTFTVNTKDLDLLRTIGGAETVISIEQVLDEIPDSPSEPKAKNGREGGLKPTVVVAESSADFAN